MKLTENKKAFSLLEMTMAMFIFAIIALSLYNMVDVLTKLQTSSLGIQRFKSEGYALMDRIEEQLSNAASGEFFLYVPGSPTNKKKSYQAHFRCYSRNSATFINPGAANLNKSNVQQIFYIYADEEVSGTTDVDYFIKYGIPSGVSVKERFLYMRADDTLAIYSRDEREGSTNKVDGLPDINTDGGMWPVLPDVFSGTVYNIEYLFWGDESIDWVNDGSGGSGNPIDSWDSDDAVSANHKQYELPRAVKVFLTITYNPDMYHARQADLNHDKDQQIVFEKVINFKNYKEMT